MLARSGCAEKFSYAIRKISYTGEPLDTSTAEFIEKTFGTIPRSMYGTTEVGTVLVNFPGADDYEVKRGSLGKPIPGTEVDVHDSGGNQCKPGQVGEIVVRRGKSWVPTKDMGSKDADGYFFYGGRADDVIISAGWTMSAIEIEDVLLKHSSVLEVAVVGVPDELRGLIPRAYVVSRIEGSQELTRELQDFARSRLSLHEYPREVEYVQTLPKTPAGKINRKVLREQARAEQKQEKAV
jgi:acetyl-CoA synthetase